jgi:hypothetical protein
MSHKATATTAKATLDAIDLTRPDYALGLPGH